MITKQQVPIFLTLNLPFTTKHSHGPRDHSGPSNRVVWPSLASVVCVSKKGSGLTEALGPGPWVGSLAQEDTGERGSPRRTARLGPSSCPTRPWPAHLRWPDEVVQVGQL